MNYFKVYKSSLKVLSAILTADAALIVKITLQLFFT